MAAPPPYSVMPLRDASKGSTSAWASARGISVPCVLPQTTKSFRGAFFSPFVRAYVPELEYHGIRKEDFVACIDGLNEAFVAHPAFQGLGIVGGVMSVMHGLPPVQWAGLGLQAASGAASAATSFARAKTYVEAVNADLFHPAGLQLNIMTTKKMMQKVGYPEERMQLPPLDQMSPEDEAALADLSPKKRAEAVAAGRTEQDDPRMRRMRALEGYVMPLDYNVPEQVMPDNLYRKMGASHAARLDKKQNKKMDKDRKEGDKKYFEKVREAEKKQRESDKEIAKLQHKLAKEQAKFNKEYPKKGDKALREFQKEESKILKDIEKEQKKGEREVSKEMRHADKERAKGAKKEENVAHKIRWVVISRKAADELESDGSVGTTSGSEDIDGGAASSSAVRGGKSV